MPKTDLITIAHSRQKVVQEILNRSWDELQVLEFQGHLLFPHQIVRYTPSGHELIDVMLQVPREPVVRKARLQARAWASRVGLNPQLDPDLFDNMDTMCILTLCIRNTTPPHEPWEPDPAVLEEKYERPSLDAAWARIEALRMVIDPQVGVVDEDTFALLIASIAKKGNIDPLAVLDSSGLENFIVRTATLLQSYLPSKS